MIDKSGFRLGIGIILINDQNQVFWGRRIGPSDAWQFPQGGVNAAENLEAAMFRELREELGLQPTQVQILGVTKKWIKYYLPPKLRRTRPGQYCLGQRQKWFLLRLRAPDTAICFDQTEKPEFSCWRWEDYWYPMKHIVVFKKYVYRKILHEFSPLLVRQEE